MYQKSCLSNFSYKRYKLPISKTWLEEDNKLRELYFVSPYRRSLRTIHFQYGSSNNKFLLKITSGEINGRGTSVGNTEEVVFETQQELLKGVYERKKELVDTGRWEITEKQSTTQPSFIQTDLMNGKITNDTWWENWKYDKEKIQRDKKEDTGKIWITDVSNTRQGTER